MADLPWWVSTSPQTKEDLLRTEQVLTFGRWLLIAWASVRFVAFDIHRGREFPAWLVPLLVALTVAVNLVVWWASRDGRRVSSPRALGGIVWLLDAVLVTVIVVAFADSTAIELWPLMMLIPVEGAIRYQLPGGIAGWGVALVLYLLTEGTEPGNGGLDVVSFRFGLGLALTAMVAVLSRAQHRQRALLAEAMERARARDSWREQLVSTLGHDLRGPISTIEGSAQALRHHRADLDAERQDELLGAIERQARRLDRLTSDLLELARAEHGATVVHRTDVEIAPVVRAALRDVAGVDVRVACQPGLTAAVDPDRLEQIVVNLVTNAVRHGRPPVEVAVASDECDLHLTVVDHGPGLPPETADAMFDPFIATEDRESVGLGLWIVRLLVEAHGGEIRYQDAATGGARFDAVFPGAVAPPSRPDERGE